MCIPRPHAKANIPLGPLKMLFTAECAIHIPTRFDRESQGHAAMADKSYTAADVIRTIKSIKTHEDGLFGTPFDKRDDRSNRLLMRFRSGVTTQWSWVFSCNGR